MHFEHWRPLLTKGWYCPADLTRNVQLSSNAQFIGSSEIWTSHMSLFSKCLLTHLASDENWNRHKGFTELLWLPCETRLRELSLLLQLSKCDAMQSDGVLLRRSSLKAVCNAISEADLKRTHRSSQKAIEIYEQKHPKPTTMQYFLLQCSTSHKLFIIKSARNHLRWEVGKIWNPERSESET